MMPGSEQQTGIWMPPSNGALMARGASQRLSVVICEFGRKPLSWGFGWSGRRESNPHDQLGRLELCH
jgi:hypothetical protein